MRQIRIAGLSVELTEAVRSTRLAPGYGHPVLAEVATGTGPCRSCFGLFEVGREERLLFTYQPDSGARTIGAPGPVFIHSDECVRHEGTEIPASLLSLPLLLEGRASDGTVLHSERSTGPDTREVVDGFLGDPRVDFVFLRHGEAGCHIARVERG